MRILMLSWEYPPATVGGLGRHVGNLSRELARRGNLVEVVTQGKPDGPAVEEARIGDGVLRVRRCTPYSVASPDFLHWAHLLNYSLLEGFMEAIAASRPAPLDSGAEARLSVAGASPYDVVHAHDWLVAFAARAIKHAARIPLVATIHATEAGRHNGIHNPWQRYISEVEWWLTYEAWRVICCSGYMEAELTGQFQLPPDKIRVIPNGVDPREVESAGEAARETFALPGEDIVFFVGRLVREKGVDTLLDAFPAVLERRPATRLVIGGTGPHEAHLRRRVLALGLDGRVRFTGHLDDRSRNLLYRWASAAVVPSYYEPFGLTALEAMAAGAPLVVSDTGGLGETVVHGETGLKVPPADPGELAGGILRLLSDPALARRLAERARATVLAGYGWSEVAARTEAVYEEVRREAEAAGWSVWRRATPGAQPSPPAGEDWEAIRQRTRAMTRGLEPIGRYNPPS